MKILKQTLENALEMVDELGCAKDASGRKQIVECIESLDNEVLVFETTFEEIPEQDNPQTHGDSSIIVCVSKETITYGETVEIPWYDIIQTTDEAYPFYLAKVYKLDVAISIANNYTIN